MCVCLCFLVRATMILRGWHIYRYLFFLIVFCIYFFAVATAIHILLLLYYTSAAAVMAYSCSMLLLPPRHCIFEWKLADIRLPTRINIVYTFIHLYMYMFNIVGVPMILFITCVFVRFFNNIHPKAKKFYTLSHRFLSIRLPILFVYSSIWCIILFFNFFLLHMRFNKSPGTVQY